LRPPRQAAGRRARLLERAHAGEEIIVAKAGRPYARLVPLAADEIDLTYAVNTRATLLLVRAFAARHDGRPGGRVVLFTSGQYHGAMPGELPYVASKGALHQLTPSLAAHLMPRGITVNCVDPGPNDTGYADRATRQAVAARMPAGRWGRRSTPPGWWPGWSVMRPAG
jgi:3-oxoacyl-[acyl-carrier protein] reductase